MKSNNFEEKITHMASFIQYTSIITGKEILLPLTFITGVGRGKRLGKCVAGRLAAPPTPPSAQLIHILYTT